VRIPILAELRQTEVANLGLQQIIQQDVGRLHVPVPRRPRIRILTLLVSTAAETMLRVSISTLTMSVTRKDNFENSDTNPHNVVRRNDNAENLDSNYDNVGDPSRQIGGAGSA
jgi:hypothetical protein